jgi:hypothetical protein
MKADNYNHAPMHDAWLNPPDDGPWCDNCNRQQDDCTCDDDDNEVT